MQNTKGNHERVACFNNKRTVEVYKERLAYIEPVLLIKENFTSAGRMHAYLIGFILHFGFHHKDP